MKIRRDRSDALLMGAASVTSSLPPLPPGEIIYGLKPPAPVPFEWMPLLIQSFGYLLLAWLLLRVAAWWKRRSDAALQVKHEEIPVDHRLEALEALERLKASPVWDEGRSKDICESLAAILKTFLHGRYSIGTGASTTTDELMEVLQKCRVSAALKQETAVLLAGCDEVRYARGSLGALTFDEVWSRFRSLITREDWRR